MDKNDVKLEQQVEKETHAEIDCLRSAADCLHHLLSSRYSDRQISTLQGGGLASFRKDREHLLKELRRGITHVSSARRRNKMVKKLSDKIKKNLHKFRDNSEGCRLTKHEKRIISDAKALDYHLDDIESLIKHCNHKLGAGLFDEARNECSEAIKKIRTVIESLSELYFVEKKLERVFRAVNLRKKTAQ